MSKLADYCRVAYGEVVEKQFGVTYDELAEVISAARDDA